MSFDEEKAIKELEKRQSDAEKLLDDDDKMERFLQRLEMKLKLAPLIGEELSNIPVLISLVRSYVKKEYTDIPIGIIISIVGALIYWLSPVDVIPDVIPGVGYLDDTAVIKVCMKFANSDINEYRHWRRQNNKEIDFY